MAGFTFLLVVLCLSPGVPQLKAADLGKAEHVQLRRHELLYEQRDIISCDACDSIAQHLRQAQKSGSEAKTLLEKGCNSLTGTQRSLCENFVQSYKKELSKLLQKSQEEKDICWELDLCVRKQTVRLLGKNKCTWGPAYWCKNRETAAKCHAADLCEMCKKFLGEIVTMLKEKAVQDAVKDALHKGCSLIPIKSFADQCNEYVDAYLPLAFQFIESELKPEVVCSALGLCKSLSRFPQQEVRSNAIPEQQPSLAHLLPSRLYPASRIPQQQTTQNAGGTQQDRQHLERQKNS
ncbi:uncharacterized protein [Hemitrygon akajei]|uniref:uncharacterized protein isoform X3 n=1 Tax=Hemitrygon akajei TaxID=2704970 RepID=UPI003BF9ABEC